MSPGWRFQAAGFALIAICYGLARFAYGLLLPQIDADLKLSHTLAGLIAGGAFVAFCVSLVLAARLTERVGARALAVGAALIAALGMLGIALAQSSAWLAAAVMVAGLSTGLASPPLAAAVTGIVQPQRQNAANTFINAGTGAGVVLSGPLAVLMGGQWRLAFALFAALALGAALAMARSVPAGVGVVTHKRGDNLLRTGGPLKKPAAAAFLAGVASTAIWSFGSQLVRQRLDWGTGGASLLWMTIGAAGILGACAGSLISRLGIDRVHWASLAGMAAGIVLIGAGHANAAQVVAGGALFGAAYIVLTGLYLVWGVAAAPGRPATGLMVSFLGLAVGQSMGAPLFGLMMGQVGPEATAIAFALLGLAAGFMRADHAAQARLSP